MKFFATKQFFFTLAVIAGHHVNEVQGAKCTGNTFNCQAAACDPGTGGVRKLQQATPVPSFKVCAKDTGGTGDDAVTKGETKCFTQTEIMDSDACDIFVCGESNTANDECVGETAAFTDVKPTAAPTECPDKTCPECTNDGGCFSAMSEVDVEGMGPVAMEDVQIGDKVLVDGSSKTYEEVYAMGHSNKDQVAEFLKIDVSTGKSVEVTAEHLLFLDGNDTPIRASAVKIGDTLETMEKDVAVVQKITTVEMQGLYTPLTPSGKVVVNDIQASSYIALQEDSKDIKIAGRHFSHQGFVHFALAPMRVVCMGINDAPCKVVASNGIPLYIEWGMTVVRMVTEGSALAFAFFAIVGVPLLAAFNAAEALFGPTFAALGCFALFAAYKYNKLNVNKKQIKQA